CLEQHIGFSFVPSLLTELQSNYDVRTIVGLPVIEVNPTPLEGWGRILKRMFDILMSAFLIILFSPLFLLISISLLIASPGPLIYKHRRIGKNGLPIDVWKFRSMKWEYCTGVGNSGDKKFAELLKKNPDLAAEWERDHKLKNDPRVTVPGKIIRKTSLDELPQFFNVLAGTLSLVGPRPIVDDEVSKYGEGARILFSVKPGVTGLWQVSGRNDVSYEERISLDTHYIEHWNLWSDIVILIKTAAVLIKKGAGGAY
ncbi:MAG: Undecaprenyl-phosphate galactose phosphotransferase, WbaP/exopolysaccharide biosynthesis polyprenyl, partial [Patescibacteria group bacterium]|nr:Undecaprenyl-phosphate galactose phosphotransferase, WbaP/exopolysaccharide biosynthesis polyprenyl [Patescibacteria group bacterium]